MEIQTEFPHDVEVVENVFIPMSDGTRLAARMWLPADAETNPVPAILEYIPYRKRDIKRTRDQQMHHYVAGHGYACVRVDIRGSGDSEGVLTDEYLEQELADGEEILAWLAEQRWCDGSVGMIGISWGGFNGLQLAARRPPALKAVVSVCSTDDRYADDVHYMGGCLLGDNLSWSAVMFGFNSLPPDPEVVGDRWREMWHERLEGSGLWLDTWLRHPTRDGYWKHGSVNEDFSAIEVPVLAVSGWADGYSNAVLRLLANLEGPRQGLIGPWSHKYPHLGVPGPAIGFLQETVRWWDHWLKGIDTGVMDEPMMRAYLQDSVAPDTSYDQRPGRWVGEPSWPSPNVTERTFRLGGRWWLAENDDDIVERELTVQSPLTVGLFAGKWCSYAASPDLPYDQREEDGGALVFESLPLTAPMEILGRPVLEVEVASDQPVAMLAVRLSDTAPDDKATRVTYGVLNLTHRDSHEDPEALEPGRSYRVQIELNDIAHRFPTGHRLRLAISTSYWPLAWLPPHPTRLTIQTGPSVLRVPVRGQQESDTRIRFEEPVAAPAPEISPLQSGEHNWLVTRDLSTDRSTLDVVDDDGWFRIEELDLDVRRDVREWYSTRGEDVTSAEGGANTELELRRGEWRVRTRTRTRLTCTAEEFVLHAELDAYEGDARVFSRSWAERIPRHLV